MKGFYFLALLMLAGSCMPKKSKAKDSSLESKVNDVTIQARLMPSVKPLKSTAAVALQTHEEIQQADSFLYFNIRMEKPDLVPDEKTRAYLDFNMQDDFVLVDRDTVLPLMVHRVVNGRKNSYEYIVAFPRSLATGSQIQVIYDDKIFGIGKQLFAFKNSDIL